MISTRLGHGVLRQILRPGERRFRARQHNLETAQRDRLARILRQVSAVRDQQALWHGGWRWEDFASTEPVTSYAHWRDPVSDQISTGRQRLTSSPTRRYQPTSGSSSAIKWIPYTRQFLQELDGAIAPWMSDLYRQFPGIARGKQYWSLSWLPSSMRQQGSDHLNDDMKLLSTGKRLLMGQTQAVPEGVALAPTSDDAMFATVACLAATPDLAVISVWSPTFALGLLSNLGRWREELAEVLRTGSWGRRRHALNHLETPQNPHAAAQLTAWDGHSDPAFFRELWPELALVSAWSTASAGPWANELRRKLPQAGFQGKALWATEGVVTIPYGDQHVLAANSHFYEFEDAATGRIHPSWDLRDGQQVSPLITTGSGLLRYRLGDLVEVTGHMGQLPCLSFLGRSNTVDLVGEKIDAVTVQQWLDDTRWPGALQPVTVLGAARGGAGDRPAYVLVVNLPDAETPGDWADQAREWARSLDAWLCESFHYRLARDLDQLEPARCVCIHSAHDRYLEACKERGMIEGDIKVESLKHWPGALPTAFTASPVTRKEEVAHEA